MKRKIQSEKVKNIRRILCVVAASLIMSVNIKSFVHTGGLIPGGFTGLTLLIQRIGDKFLGIAVPFSVINVLLNAVPAAVAYKTIGKRFTIYSCLAIILTSVFTDMIPAKPLTNDILLISVFGGIISGLAISICLRSGATSGGTDFIAIYMSEKRHIDAWNYILLGNAAMLIIAGFLFEWNDALYSIIFQFASTQVVQMLHLRYKKHTLFIVTDKPQEVYQVIYEHTNHGATFFNGVGGYEREGRTMIYSVVSSDEVKRVVHAIRKVDERAFINTVKTDQLDGRFYQRPND